MNLAFEAMPATDIGHADFFSMAVDSIFDDWFFDLDTQLEDVHVQQQSSYPEYEVAQFDNKATYGYGCVTTEVADYKSSSSQHGSSDLTSSTSHFTAPSNSGEVQPQRSGSETECALTEERARTADQPSKKKLGRPPKRETKLVAHPANTFHI